MRLLNSTFILLSALSTSSCTTRIGDLTAASTKNLPQKFEVVKSSVEGRDCLYQLLFIPLGKLNPTIDGALDDALSKVPGAEAMADATLQQTIFYTLIYNQLCMTIRGDAIRTR